jgi:biopolymer transport protein ExbB
MELPHDFDTWVQWLTFLPRLLASLTGCALVLIMAFEHRRTNVFPVAVRDQLWRLIETRDFVQAAQVARAKPVRATPLVLALLGQAGRSTALLKERATLVGSAIARDLETGLGTLSLIAGLGPLFGLFGTVVGIVIVFSQLSTAEGVMNPQQMAGGIGTALYTTIVGLIIGVLALVSHLFFTSRLEQKVAELEELGLDLVERLSGGAP